MTNDLLGEENMLVERCASARGLMGDWRVDLAPRGEDGRVRGSGELTLEFRAAAMVRVVVVVVYRRECGVEAIACVLGIVVDDPRARRCLRVVRAFEVKTHGAL